MGIFSPFVEIINYAYALNYAVTPCISFWEKKKKN